MHFQDLAANIAVGHAVNNTVVKLSFPTDNSKDSILARFNAASDTLQNLFGPGKGCPIVSTTWQAQSKAVSDGTSPLLQGSSGAAPSSAPVASSSAPAPPPAAATTTAAAAPASTSASTSDSGSLSLSQLDALTPQFGHDANVNPTGTGDCDGAVNGADGKPIKVPCSCPPPRDQFLQSLLADIKAGHAVNNPSVKVSFPTDDSKASQITRIQSSLVALQNLNGEGKGCPAASTTFSAQLKALTG